MVLCGKWKERVDFLEMQNYLLSERVKELEKVVSQDKLDLVKEIEKWKDKASKLESELNAIRNSRGSYYQWYLSELKQREQVEERLRRAYKKIEKQSSLISKLEDNVKELEMLLKNSKEHNKELESKISSLSLELSLKGSYIKTLEEEKKKLEEEINSLKNSVSIKEEDHYTEIVLPPEVSEKVTELIELIKNDNWLVYMLDMREKFIENDKEPYKVKGLISGEVFTRYRDSGTSSLYILGRDVQIVTEMNKPPEKPDVRELIVIEKEGETLGVLVEGNKIRFGRVPKLAKQSAIFMKHPKVPEPTIEKALVTALIRYYNFYDTDHKLGIFIMEVFPLLKMLGIEPTLPIDTWYSSENKSKNVTFWSLERVYSYYIGALRDPKKHININGLYFKAGMFHQMLVQQIDFFLRELFSKYPSILKKVMEKVESKPPSLETVKLSELNLSGKEEGTGGGGRS
ncbi:MAG: hypothetical protein QI197_04465 [Candidatus Korarchaeota archaeon]|nr:hypothetical protein [Candidatus Korarchaeota archaeon]